MGHFLSGFLEHYPAYPNPVKATLLGQGYEDLKNSIRSRGGLLQPVVVRPHPDPHRAEHFQLIAGERRWRAVNDVGLSKIAVMVLPLSDQEAQVVVREENDLREGLADIDRKVSMLRAIAHDAGVEPGQLVTVFVRLRNKPGETWAEGSVEALTLESMARLHAPSLATLVGQWSRFLSFTPAECEALAGRQVSDAVVVALSKLPEGTAPEVRAGLLAQAIDEQWTGRQMGEAVRRLEVRPVPPERARAAALAETRSQVQSALSKAALKSLPQEAQETLLAEIQALIEQAKIG